MRGIVALTLAAAVIATGCGIATSTSQPTRLAPSLEPGEQPIKIVELLDRAGGAPLTLRIYDRSLALDEARTITKQEFGEVFAEPITDENQIGLYQATDGVVAMTWLASACPSTADMFVGPGVTEVLIVPAGTTDCAAGTSLHGVQLLFRPSVDLKRIGVAFARPLRS